MFLEGGLRCVKTPQDDPAPRLLTYWDKLSWCGARYQGSGDPQQAQKRLNSFIQTAEGTGGQEDWNTGILE
jgi:hypothetical protein